MEKLISISPEVQSIHRRIWASVESLWVPNTQFGHGPDHALRIYRHAIQIANEEGADILATGVACYLTDAGLDPVNGRENHIEKSLAIADKLLCDIPELDSVRHLVFESIQHHEVEHIAPANISLEARIVRDSETLDRLGLTGINMTLSYGLWKSRALYHPEDPMCHSRTPQLEDFSMDYVRYLFDLEAFLCTNAAKALGQIKVEEMIEYCTAFESLIKEGRPQYSDALALLAKYSRGMVG